QANEIGPKTSALIEIILRERTHPEQGFRATIGILRHASNFGHERLEAACGRALDIGARSYTSVTSILKNNLDRQRPATATDGSAIVHSNIRGPRYFHLGDNNRCPHTQPPTSSEPCGSTAWPTPSSNCNRKTVPRISHPP